MKFNLTSASLYGKKGKSPYGPKEIEFTTLEELINWIRALKTYTTFGRQTDGKIILTVNRNKKHKPKIEVYDAYVE